MSIKSDLSFVYPEYPIKDSIRSRIKNKKKKKIPYSLVSKKEFVESTEEDDDIYVIKDFIKEVGLYELDKDESVVALYRLYELLLDITEDSDASEMFVYLLKKAKDDVESLDDSEIKELRSMIDLSSGVTEKDKKEIKESIMKSINVSNNEFSNKKLESHKNTNEYKYLENNKNRSSGYGNERSTEPLEFTQGHLVGSLMLAFGAAMAFGFIGICLAGVVTIIASQSEEEWHRTKKIISKHIGWYKAKRFTNHLKIRIKKGLKKISSNIKGEFNNRKGRNVQVDNDVIKGYEKVMDKISNNIDETKSNLSKKAILYDSSVNGNSEAEKELRKMKSYNKVIKPNGETEFYKKEDGKKEKVNKEEYENNTKNKNIKKTKDGKSKKMTPDEYRKKHGRCPDGYVWDKSKKKCVKNKK